MTGPRIAGTLPVGKVGSRECARVTRCTRVHQKLEILAAHSLTRLTTELERTLAVSDAFHEFSPPAYHGCSVGNRRSLPGNDRRVRRRPEAGQLCHGNNSECDGSLGIGEGVRDACPVHGGVVLGFFYRGP